MFDIWQSLSDLRQPCLARPLSEMTIDGEGVVKNSVMKSIDTLLWENVERELIESDIPHLQERCEYTTDKWLTTSALQKCIRRGHTDLAERYVRSGVQIDADHTFRRLAIIALEDVGLGDLELVSTSLAILSDKRRRQRLGEEPLAVLLATRMSEAIKSRLACEMLSLVEYDLETANTAKSLYGLDELNLSKIIRSEEMGSARQIICLWLLHGTYRLRSQRLARIAGNGHRGLLRVLSRLQAPLIFHYIVKMGLSRSRDNLAIPYATLAKLAEENPLVETTCCEIPIPELIGDYPAFAYDMHTQLGRGAIREFEVNCTNQLRELGVRSAANLVFALEGGVLNQWLRNKKTDKIANRAMQFEVFGAGGEGRPPVLEPAEIISTLNQFRRHALVSR